MYIEVKENVKTIKELVEFLSKLPQDISASRVSFGNSSETTSSGKHVRVLFPVYDIELIDCGDHAMQPYPKDLLVSLHHHE